MIYFDNASTTKMDESVIEIMNKSFEDDFANPSSLHSLGFSVEKMIRDARLKFAKFFKVKADQIFFSPSASIANNTVLMSLIDKNKKILVSEVEHSSIINLLKNNPDANYDFIKVNEYSFVDEEDLLSKVDDETALVSIMHVQNELGSINNINRLARLCKEKNPKVLFHSDGVQALNKIEIDLKDVDFYTIAGHKINGPKGIGVLFVRNKNNIHPLYFGGGQESGLFSGTENTYAIMGFAKALELNNNYEEIKKVNDYLRKGLEKIEGIRIISPVDYASPYILNFCIEGIGAEILLHYLEMDEVYISTGSACSKGAESRVLKAIGLDGEAVKGCIRISFDRNSSLEEGSIFLEKLEEKINLIRRIIK